MAAIRGADCHAHVFDPARFPYTSAALYTPPPSVAGTPEQFLAVLDAHRLTHGLIVGPGPYGTNNDCLVAAIARSGKRLKGIALVEHDVSEKEIARLSTGGVIGIRMNLFHEGVAPLLDARAPRLLALLKEANWFCQIQCGKDQMVTALPILRKAGVRVLIDHCGRPDAERGVKDGGFQAVLELGRSSDAVMKLSGPFRFSKEPYPYRDTEPFYAAAIEAFTLERCIWGSDWPFVRIDARIDYGPTLACLERWLADEQDRRKVLWETPARLFGFE